MEEGCRIIDWAQKYEPVQVSVRLKDMLQQIRKILKESPNIADLPASSLAQLKRLIFEGDLEPADWEPLVFFQKEGYTRNMIIEAEETDNFDLLLVSWLPGQHSVIHDHAGSHCLMRILRGSVQESLYGMQQDEEGQSGCRLEKKRCTELGAGESTYINGN